MPPLRMPHHATLCFSCLNCQSNFRLKVFLLFLTPTAVSFSVYSFFCFSHASVLPDFLNWLFTLPPLHMPPHATLCSSSRVPAVVFQLRVPAFVVPAVVFQQSCSSFVFQQSCSSSRVPAVVFQHSCSSSRVPASCSSIRVPAFVIAFVLQHLCSHLCCSICVRICVAASVFAFVLQHLVFALVLQHLCSHWCCSVCVRIGVAASVFHLCCSVCVSASVFLHLFSIHNRLPSMTTLIICVISVVAIFPTISPFGIDGNMSFISPPLTSKAEG
jgi:hypothetical protein